MAFNSIEYLIFLFAVVCVHLCLPLRFRLPWILAASYYFYAQWNDKYLVLIVFSTVLDYCCARMIDRRASGGRAWLALSLLGNLGLLFSFKYYGFFSLVALQVSQWMDRPMYLPVLEVILPVGISFYTLQTMSYSIDVWKRQIPAERNFFKFAVYVANFPQLVAGPIERAANILPQLGKVFKLGEREIVFGCQMIAWGLFKKVVIADRLLLYVDVAFNSEDLPGNVTMALNGFWANVLIYADFSAYADIAIGSAALIGLKLGKNFNFPLYSRSMPDFWKRWHITLHTWFLDYVYYPLGGSRVGWSRLMFNIFVIFILSGLWHGAAWNFVVWSLFHMTLVIVHVHVMKLYKKMGWGMWKGRLATIVEVGLVHVQRGLSMYLFFIPDVGKSLEIYKNFFSAGWSINLRELMPFHLFNFVVAVFFTLFLFFVEFLHLKKSWRERLYGMPRWFRWSCYLFILFSIMIFGIETDNPFIYFQF